MNKSFEKGLNSKSFDSLKLKTYLTLIHKDKKK